MCNWVSRTSQSQREQSEKTLKNGLTYLNNGNNHNRREICLPVSTTFSGSKLSIMRFCCRKWKIMYTDVNNKVTCWMAKQLFFINDKNISEFVSLQFSLARDILLRVFFWLICLFCYKLLNTYSWISNRIAGLSEKETQGYSQKTSRSNIKTTLVKGDSPMPQLTLLGNKGKWLLHRGLIPAAFLAYLHGKELNVFQDHSISSTSSIFSKHSRINL